MGNKLICTLHEGKLKYTTRYETINDLNSNHNNLLREINREKAIRKKEDNTISKGSLYHVLFKY